VKMPLAKFVVLGEDLRVVTRLGTDLILAKLDIVIVRSSEEW
jgi:hypothetical protein